MRVAGPINPGSENPHPQELLAIYERYARPLESQHHGQYIAISRDGDVLLDNDLLTLSTKAKAQFGTGSYVFKLGEIAVGKWLCLMSS